MNKPILSIQNVSYRYKDATASEYALKNVNYDFSTGKVYAIRGRSGTGKTTLLSLITGLEKCTEGKILFEGKNLNNINLDKYRNTDIGIVFQSYNLLPFMTTLENIVLSIDISGIKEKNKKEKALKLMKDVGLKKEFANRRILKLSGGEQQRVAIARAIVNGPKILICDEPTGNLDPKTSLEIMDVLEAINELGTTIIMVTHDIDIVNKLKKRTVLLDSGRIVKDYKEGEYKNEDI